MARLPLTVDSPDYHHLFETFAFDAAAELADTLLDEKVSKAKAHEITAGFLFRFAMMFDGGGHYRTGGKYRPQLAFSNGLGQVIVPTEETYLHELAFEVVEHVFNIEGRR